MEYTTASLLVFFLCKLHHNKDGKTHRYTVRGKKIEKKRERVSERERERDREREKGRR